MRQVSARAGELMTAVALFATGLFFAWRSTRLPFGNAALPGPGFFPFALGTILSVVALAIAIRTARHPRTPGAPVVHLGHRDVFMVFAALAGAGIAFERLGAYASLGLFTAALLLIVARVPLWRAALGASLGMVAVWAFFRVLLGVQLPTGPF